MASKLELDVSAFVLLTIVVLFVVQESMMIAVWEVEEAEEAAAEVEAGQEAGVGAEAVLVVIVQGIREVAAEADQEAEAEAVLMVIVEDTVNMAAVIGVVLTERWLLFLY